MLGSFLVKGVVRYQKEKKRWSVGKCRKVEKIMIYTDFKASNLTSLYLNQALSLLDYDRFKAEPQNLQSFSFEELSMMNLTITAELMFSTKIQHPNCHQSAAACDLNFSVRPYYYFLLKRGTLRWLQTKAQLKKTLRSAQLMGAWC